MEKLDELQASPRRLTTCCGRHPADPVGPRLPGRAEPAGQLLDGSSSVSMTAPAKVSGRRPQGLRLRRAAVELRRSVKILGGQMLQDLRDVRRARSRRCSAAFRERADELAELLSSRARRSSSSGART